jgi:hypothetical protein
LGNTALEQFCLERATAMYKGSVAVPKQFIRQNLPAILEDSEYTIENLTSDVFIDSVVEAKYQPVLTGDVKKENIFGIHLSDYFMNVISDSDVSLDEADAEWDYHLSLSKEELVKRAFLDPTKAKRWQLVFPTTSNFDTLNPILWNAIIDNFQDTAWLEKLRVIDGTDNQTDGTV